jgi:hypothetical protein
MAIGEHVKWFEQLVDELAEDRSWLDTYYEEELRSELRRWLEDLATGDRESAIRLSIQLVTGLCNALELERKQTARLCDLLVAELQSIPDDRAA